MFATQSLGALFLASVAQGHMIMNTPQPYSSPAVVNSPLNADGSNFPCQLTAGESLVAGSASNTFALGSEQALKFTGQAVHGGGSCQVSITYDSAPSKDSVWKVIRSIEGGCPAQGQTGNMGDDASAADPYTYNFTVPDNIPTGSVTLAWTWFNKIGNREMYMNCAPVTLTGTSGSQSNFDSLPDMFVANVGNECGTVDSTDLLFPNPGADVVSMNGATSAFSTPTGSGCQAAGASPAAGGGTAGTTAAAAGTTAAAAGTTAAAAGTTAAASGLPGGVFVTSGGSAPAATTPATTPANTPATTAAAVGTTTAAAVATTAAATTAAAATGSSSSSSGSSGTTQTVGSACSPDGVWNCLGSSYQRCASGVWSAVMALADGTVCTGGQGDSINIVQGRDSRRVALRFRA
ncbi:hypothetical protein SBRCBS47491_006557 [Sporothrix bragantina]|uniref:Uncharacterized protein n=1 Tax=Sporothrix bragantina TaxID=671064 RepID=A0ABP0C6F3_9PEZI